MGILSRVLGALAEAPINIIGNMVEFLFRTSPKRQGYHSDFLPPTDLASRYNFGFAITGNRFLTAKISHTHCLVMGASGTGKTTTVGLPSAYNLIKHGHSLCLHDPAGEFQSKLSGFAVSRGYRLVELNFAHSAVSDGWNPLLRAHCMSDYMKISSALVRNALGKGGDSAFWNTQASAVLAVMCGLAKTLADEYHTFANVKQLLEIYLIDSKKIDILIAQSGNPELIQEYKLIVSMEPRVLSNVIATCRAACSLWMDNHIKTMTGFDTIDFASFRKEKTILFIRTNTADMSYYSVLTSLFMQQFFASIMEQLPEKKDKHIFFIIDEASSIYLPDTLQIALSNLRKYNSGIMLILQDYNQLKHLYGNAQAEAIKTNCYTRIYFPGQPIDVCRDLEQMLGKYQYEDKQGRSQTRQLLTADEIQTMEEDHALIFCTGKRACYAKMKPYYRHWRYNSYSKYPMPELTSKVPFDTVPLFK